MANIREINGRFSVEIRKRSVEIRKTFSCLEDAQLFAAWKEDIIDQMASFEPEMKEIITLGNAIDLKIDQLTKEGKDKRTIGAIQVLKKYFHDLLDKSICDVTYDDLLKKANDLLKTMVKHGGDQTKEGTGTLKLPSRQTILSRYNVFGSVYSNLIANGVNVENIPHKVLCYLKTLE